MFSRFDNFFTVINFLENKLSFLQIYDFDKGMPESKEVLDKDLINIEKEVINAANNIKNNNFKNKCNDIKCICHLH